MSDRLFAYDRRIVVNSIRATLAPWQDKLIAVIGLLMLVAGLRTSLAHRPWTEASWAALAVGGAVGLTAGRVIAVRLAFHACDGALAADALRAPTRQRYLIAGHAVGLLVLAVVTLVARPSLMLVSLPAYAAGALVGGGILGFGPSERAVQALRYRRMIRSWVQHPRAGMVSAATLSLSLWLLAGVVGTIAIRAIAGLQAAIMVLALTVVEHGLVRFLTIAGQSPWQIIARHARGALLFVALAPLMCALAVDVMAAGIVAAIAIAALLLMTMRILAYRLHGKRSADVLVSILVALLILVAFSLPIMTPLVAIAMLWLLLRRSATTTWMLA
ncbi:MAG: hypothetical protein K2R93_21745 [Gemmatimonadaceae bacterium]|nr:hypothetical protein [Gemmatimonadaceae bacterium]